MCASVWVSGDDGRRAGRQQGGGARRLEDAHMQAWWRGRPPVLRWESVLGGRVYWVGGAGAGTPADASNGRREQWGRFFFKRQKSVKTFFKFQSKNHNAFPPRELELAPLRAVHRERVAGGANLWHVTRTFRDTDWVRPPCELWLARRLVASHVGANATPRD